MLCRESSTQLLRILKKKAPQRSADNTEDFVPTCKCNKPRRLLAAVLCILCLLKIEDNIRNHKFVLER